MLTRQPMRRPFEVRLTFCAKTVVALVAAAGDKGNSSLELLRVAKIVVLCLTINNQLTQHRQQQRLSVRMFRWLSGIVRGSDRHRVVQVRECLN